MEQEYLIVEEVDWMESGALSTPVVPFAMDEVTQLVRDM